MGPAAKSSATNPLSASGKDPAQRYARARRRAVIAGAALLLLLASSAATAQLHLGQGNLAAALGIALLKVSIVAGLFMGMGSAAVLLRVVAAIGLAALAVLAGLSAVDFGPRRNEPAAWQPPQQIAPALAERPRPVDTGARVVR
jgi:caa(3)-type oxidase subunit IV